MSAHDSPKDAYRGSDHIRDGVLDGRVGEARNRVRDVEEHTP